MFAILRAPLGSWFSVARGNQDLNSRGLSVVTRSGTHDVVRTASSSTCFEANHRWAMATGEKSLRLEFGTTACPQR